MFRIYVFSLLILIISSCSPADKDGADNSNPDFSDDKVVLQEVNRIMKKSISMNDICIKRPESFKDLVLVGFFAHDRGCAGGLKFYKGKEINNETEHSIILEGNGWHEKEKREVIALNWVKDVALTWSIPMEKEDEEFGSQDEYTFMPPTVMTNGDEITVAIWVKQPSGMTRASYYHLLTVVFSVSKADIIRSQITDRFSVEYESE